MEHDAVIIGGGIAGLTAAAFLSRGGRSVLLLEKEAACGGLISSFEVDGFVYDGGIRATENSGVLFPMLKQLGLEIEFLQNRITVGMEDRVMHVRSEESLAEYRDLLNHFYPESRDEIAAIAGQMKKIMHYMDVQYSIDNPTFLDLQQDREYLVKKILPWMVKYALTFRKINALNDPVVPFLRRFTSNQALLDIITQHFFEDTPAFFALSYLKIYLDYHYPAGGTGTIIREMTDLIRKQGGTIRNNTLVTRVDPEGRMVADSEGNTYRYRQLVWAANLKSLYASVDVEMLTDAREQAAVAARREAIADKKGNDSILTVYLGVDLDPDYFEKIASGHFFYTPQRTGESAAGPMPGAGDREAIEAWLARFFALTTYEISIPALRDRTLAPAGKTGLIVSVLFSYDLTQRIHAMGWYEDFKALCERQIIETLDGSIYPGIRDAVLHRFTATPLTMERRTGNAHGAITGWAFTNDPIPAEHRLHKIFSATQTPIHNVVQAGQWSYSPSGLPISILTGKLAADSVIKALK